jgi:hypothetical protein
LYLLSPESPAAITGIKIIETVTSGVNRYLNRLDLLSAANSRRRNTAMKKIDT